MLSRGVSDVGMEGKNHLDVVWNAVSIQISVKTSRRQMKLADRAPAVQVHNLQALLQVSYQHIGRQGSCCRSLSMPQLALARSLCHLRPMPHPIRQPDVLYRAPGNLWKIQKRIRSCA